MPHIHEKIDFTVEVLLVHNNTVLLRKHDKYKKWLSVGGHIELNEDPNQAAVREVKEEVGLDVVLFGGLNFNQEEVGAYTELIPPRFLNRHSISDTHEHVTMTYFAKVNTNVILQGQDEVSDGLRWFAREELDDPSFAISDSIIYYAKTALDELGGGRFVIQ